MRETLGLNGKGGTSKLRKGCHKRKREVAGKVGKGYDGSPHAMLLLGPWPSCGMNDSRGRIGGEQTSG